jgi:hypothetical protein
MGAGQLAAVLAREVVSIRRAGLCVHKTVRNVTEAQKKEVMQRYGLPESDLAKVEIDHFISLEIGGSNDVEEPLAAMLRSGAGSGGLSWSAPRGRNRDFATPGDLFR